MRMRYPLKYAVKIANTERLKRSSIPYMQKLLNIDDRKRKLESENLDKQLSLKQRKGNFHKLSLYASKLCCFNDPITLENKAYYYYYY